MGKLIGLIIAAIVVIGGGYYLFTQSSSSSDVASDNTDGSAMEEALGRDDSDSFTGSIRELMAQGKDLMCDFELMDEVGDQSGTVYLSGENMRGDFVMTQPDGTVFNTSVIRDGEFGYTWGATPFGTMATKLKLDAVDAPDSDKSDDVFDVDEDLDYDCRSWNVDRSMFIPPSGVNFDEITQEVQQIQEATDQLQGLKCDACDQIPPGSGRDQCLQALGC